MSREFWSRERIADELYRVILADVVADKNLRSYPVSSLRRSLIAVFDTRLAPDGEAN